MLWREEGTLTGIGAFFFFSPQKNQQNIAEILPPQLIFPNKSPINRLSLFAEICRFFPVNHLFDIWEVGDYLATLREEKEDAMEEPMLKAIQGVLDEFEDMMP